MLSIAKIIFLWGIVFTTICSYVDQAVPYFPIEFSRMASGPVARIVFPVFMLLTCVVACIESQNTYVLIGAPGLFLLSLMNDDNSFIMHFIGITLLFFGVLLHNIVHCCDTHSLLVSFSLCLVPMYIGLKIYAVYSEKNSIRRMIKDVLHINYTGEGTADQLFYFKLSGVTQWLLLGLSIASI